ncbi:MORC family CW-type zinc finger protein 1 [Elephas maximus indicus]|uniref:MORC family CW-type zinc finger protein 1 n=1 Tax=Elephas maximus indicus TaxID=99487 RepID=UPI002116A5FD|nr:MORC family CW-type zinc finger protein 1 [Elephas maximus indicus]
MGHRDAGATRLDVFSVDNETLQGGFMLCFLDDGCGMSPEEASDIIYFGTSKKRLSALKFIGQYGNGLKSGSMRIGKDFILFTKKEETMTCVFFSQTFCEREGLSEVVVPIPSWLTRTKEYVTNDPIKFSTEVSIIYKYSPFKTEAELMQQFDMIYGKCGTLLVIYNLKLLLNGEPELDVKTDQEDILVAGALEDFPERWSFRAYTSVLYFDPRMRIFIQAKRVKTKHLCHSLYRPRKYLYVTSSFKGTFKNEVKNAEEAVKIAELILKEAQMKVNKLDTTLSPPPKNALQEALGDVEAKRETLKQKRRELKKAKTLSLFFGVSVENRSQAGMFIYSNSRLIKMREKVGPQLKLKSLLGAGVVGIVNIPLEIMEPSHNKQEFLNVQEYSHLLKVMGQYLVQYCKDTGISNRNLSLFWNEFEYQNTQDVEKSLDSLGYQRRQVMAIPFIIQCDLCLKWRVLPSSTNYQEKEFLDIWICANNPNPLENSCHQMERLPSIPLGTMSTATLSKNEKEKHLRELVHRYQNKLTEQQLQPQLIPPSRIAEFTTTCQTAAPKENTETQRIRPPGGDLKPESVPSFELSVHHGGQKRHTDGSDSDVEFISETKTVKKTMQEKVKPRQGRHPAAPPENVEPAEGSQVLDKRDTGISLKQEKKEVPLMNKEKQELYSVTPEIKRNSSLCNLKSTINVTMEDVNASSGHRARVSGNGDYEVASSMTESFQNTFVKETARKLMSNLREILLFFFPEYQLPSEFNHACVEEPLASSELEQCPEQTNKKLKLCFNQIQNVYMVQYEKRLKRKMRSIVSDAARRQEVSGVRRGQCEEKRKLTEEKLERLRVKLTVLLQKLQLGGPAGGLEQIDGYLEALLKEDNRLFQNALNKVTIESGHKHNLPVEKNKSASQN